MHVCGGGPDDRPPPRGQPAWAGQSVDEETLMRAAEHEIPVELELGALLTRGQEWGGQVVRHLTLPAGTDFGPLLKGLPGDVCHCPHWGYILEGSIHLRYTDGTEELSRAGDLYYWPAGHTGWTDE